MKRSLLLVLVLVISISIVLSFSLAGCKTAAVEEAPAEEVSEEVGGTLSILCFQGYAEDDWVKPFEEKYNCKVEITYAGTVEEHFTKTKAAPDQYNIISNDSGRVQMYYDAGLIQAIDVSKLENYSKVGEYFRKHPYAEMEEGKKFHVPITWGDQDFIVNTDAVGDKLEAYLTDVGDGKQTLSYEVMKAPEFEGLVTMFDEATNVTNMSAISAGYTPPFTLDEDGYAAMIEELTAWAENCRTFTAGFDSEKSILTGEDAYISITGNNAIEAMALVEEGMGDKFTHFLPTEGTICWIDGWVITKPTEGASLDLALKYIDYMIGDEGQTKLAELVGFGIVNAAGSGGYTDVGKERVWWYSGSIDDFPVPLYVMVTEEDPERRVDTWNEIKAGLGF
ncbi:MAG: extracellular solute-binding protein [Actinobacteria bacterium]|nr:extracellular solute-binding protein [Actinomycetota bacterium]